MKYTKDYLKELSLKKIKEIKEKSDDLSADDYELVCETYNEKLSQSKGQRGSKAKSIDWNVVINMVTIGCTQNEICKILDVHKETLRKRCLKERDQTWGVFYDRYKCEGNMGLRKSLRVAANDGNTQVLIFLAKNELDMSERVETKTKLDISSEEINSINKELDGEY